jgi:hypothetical protein
MAKIPDRLNIDKKTDRELYDKIKEEVFLEMPRKDQFLFAMAFGFMYGTKRELGTKDGFFLAKDMGPRDEALINALAVAETGSVAVLSNRARVYQIAEEYAHAGIRLLHDEVTSEEHGSFYKRFERDIFERLEGHM